jgi:Zn-finger nucleic acid-binding protein
MRCPKCGSELQEVAFGDVHVDKCFHCEGLWLDSGELERLQTKEAGFVSRLLGAFRA